jgi:Tat protein secretion system quality control protein TatD with DNase activity
LLAEFLILFSQILEVISGVKGEDPEKLAEIFYNNTMKVFFPES